MNTRRIYALFAIFSFLMLIVLAIAPAKSYFREWKNYQEEFNRLAAEKAKENILVRPVEVGIKQTWNPELGVIDRCTSCHLGVEEPALQHAPQPFTTHPTTPHSFQKFGCTICHGGQGAATTAAAAHGRGVPWEQPLLPGIFAQASCGQCHTGPEVPEAYVLNQGRRLINQAGCIGCHKIPGFRRADMIGPDLSGVGSKVKPYWLYHWLKRPRDYLPRTFMPNALLTDQEAKVLTRFLMSLKDEKVEQTIQSAPPEEPSEDQITRGQTLYRLARCISCHAQEGRGGTTGPELTRVASKVNRQWLLAWLKNPQQYLPRTRMPRFSFPEKDIESLVAYIESEFEDYDIDPEEVAKLEASLPPATKETLSEGERLFKKHGCAGCHTINGLVTKGGIGPDLDGIGSKDVDRLDFGDTSIEHTLWSWLRLKVKKPRAFAKNLKMPEYEFTDDQVRAIVVALLSLSGRHIPTEDLPPHRITSSWEPQGEFGRVIRKYNCLTCHKINGHGGTLAPDLSIEGSQANPQWIANYFKLPYSLRPILEERMPLLHMTDDEIRTVIDYFRMVLVDDTIPTELPYNLKDNRLIERGRKLYFEKYDCEACHQIRQVGGYVGPALDGVGDWLYPGYIYSWLKDPQAFRPKTVEPNHGLSDDEAAALTAFVMSLPAPQATAGARR